MRLVYALVGLAALLFVVGAVGTITAFVAHLDQGVRVFFMWVCLAGLVPTMALCALGMCVGLYDVYRYRVRGDQRPSETA